MKIKITKFAGQMPGQNYEANILDAPDGEGGMMDIGCGAAETAEQALLVAGAMLAERDLPIFGAEIEVQTSNPLHK